MGAYIESLNIFLVAEGCQPVLIDDLDDAGSPLEEKDNVLPSLDSRAD